MVTDTDLTFESVPPDPSIFDITLNEFEFSARVSHCFRIERIVTLADLVRKTESELLRLPNFGKKSLKEVRDYGTGIISFARPCSPPTLSRLRAVSQLRLVIDRFQFQFLHIDPDLW